MAGEGLTWRRKIIQKLGQRNLQELKSFDDLVKAHNRLFEVADSSKSKITQLEIQIFQLHQERAELQGRIQELSSSGAGNPGGAVTSEKVSLLEQKLFKAQEELTELHRWKSEHAQKITELNNVIRQKEEEVLQKEAQLQDTISNQNAMKTECQNLGQTICDLEKANEMLKDELQVLQLEYTSLDEKHRKTQDENRELVERWMIQKAKDADKVNMENELQVRTRQAQLQRELLEAAKEPVNIPNLMGSASDLTTPHIPYCVITTIPAYPQTKFDAHDGEVLSAKFSISGRLFVTGGGDKKVKVWETNNDTCLPKGTMHGCTYAVTSVQFDVQEKLILASSNDQACRVWTVGDERLRHTLTGHQNKVMTAKFMGADATKVVSGSHDRTLKIWDLRSKACIRTVFAGSSCNDLVINELIGSQIISGHFDKRVRFWDSRSESTVGEITLQGKVTSLDLSPDMNQVLASTRDDTVKVIDLRMSQVVTTCSADGFRLATDWTRACFSPDGQYVMCGSQDGSAYIWNNSTARLEKVLKDHSSAVIVAAWHPSGSSIISCDRNKHAIMWTNRYG